MVGALCGMSSIAVLVGSLTQAQLLQFGFRLPFLGGALCSFLLLYFAKNLKESSIFSKNRTIFNAPALPIFCHARWQGLFAISLLSFIFAGILAILLFLNHEFISASFVIESDILAIGFIVSLLFLSVGAVFFGFLTDRTNASRVLILGAIGLMTALFGLFYDLRIGGSFLLIGMTFVGFFLAALSARCQLLWCALAPRVIALAHFASFITQFMR